MSEGYVYLLTNVAMPGYVKIGFTAQEDWTVRLKQLDTTSTPLPFECFYVAKVPDCRKLERTLHYVFGEKRARSSREFFTTDPDLAKAIIELVAIKEEAVADVDQDIAPAQRADIEATRRRGMNVTFDQLRIKVGTVLSFTKDPTITCTVAGPSKVSFHGEELSLSQAALKAIHAMGYAWPAVNGFKYWTLDGVRLSTLAEAHRQGESIDMVG
jgi:hypothetical protein